jgi:catechol 2,3-dioxygenase-like lactoylglutathione lyase family enzyme
MAAKLRHFALVVKDQERSAKFYEEAFGFSRAGFVQGTLGSAQFMSDGVVCLALLHYLKGHKGSGLNDDDFVGSHHFGIQVDDLTEAGDKIKAAGGTFFYDLGDATQKKKNFERKFKDPDGIIFDISHTGWSGTADMIKE